MNKAYSHRSHRTKAKQGYGAEGGKSSLPEVAKRQQKAVDMHELTETKYEEACEQMGSVEPGAAKGDK